MEQSTNLCRVSSCSGCTLGSLKAIDEQPAVCAAHFMVLSLPHDMSMLWYGCQSKSFTGCQQQHWRPSRSVTSPHQNKTAPHTCVWLYSVRSTGFAAVRPFTHTIKRQRAYVLHTGRQMRTADVVGRAPVLAEVEHLQQPRDLRSLTQRMDKPPNRRGAHLSNPEDLHGCIGRPSRQQGTCGTVLTT